MQTDNVIYREDLYPRFEPNHAAIQKYSESIEYLPPIKINQNNILIDGYHRWKAYQLAKVNEIKTEIIETASEQELKILAYKLNSIHGLQLTIEEKKKFAREMFGIISEQEIADTISVGKRSVYNWTTTQRENAKAETERKAIELYLRAWNTQESIAEKLGVTQQSVSNIITKNCTDAKICKDFKPYLYNIWTQLKGNDTEHFGSFPVIYMENLLYYHTQIFDIIYDPFTGDGTMIDVCKKWLRRYYCSDMIVKPGREKDIVQRNIQDGFPDGLQKPDLVFLDPPYWKQAAGKYSNNPDDLGNMEIEDFYNIFQNFLSVLMNKKVKRIAIVIQPTQFKNNFVFEDHIFKFDKMLSGKYDIEMRYILPYSTQQYTPQMVEMTKKEQKCLALNRDLVIWKMV